LAQSIIEKTEPGKRYFNDFNFYDNLCRQDGCTRVDISSIRVRHNHFCHGFQVQYRSTFENGSECLTWSEPHFFSSGYYAFHSGRPEEASWVLAKDEYITGLQVQQGHIVDGITFITNHRQLHTGGYGGGRVDMNLANTRAQYRIVAFAGTADGVLHRIGYFAKPFAWSIIRHFVMLRWLKYRGRAFDTDDGEESVINALINLGEYGIFKEILEYLA